MKIAGTNRIVFLVIFHFLVFSASFSGQKLYAQSEAKVEPAQISVTGNTHTNLKRRIYVSFPEVIEKYRPIAFDLSRSDGLTVFPAGAIRFDEPGKNDIRKNEMIFPVGFNLEQSPGSGQYSGKIRLLYTTQKGENGSVTIPVSITVKDHWIFPAIVLLFGAVLGVCVTVYRSQGKPRDEILIRVDRLENQMRRDDKIDLAGPFKSKIDSHLVDVQSALLEEKWKEGKQAVEQAEKIWNKWRKGRPDWIRQLEYYNELAEKLQSQILSEPYVLQMRRALNQIYSRIPEYGDPGALGVSLDDMARQLNLFIHLYSKMKRLRENIDRLSENDQKKQWSQKTKQLESELENIKAVPSTPEEKSRESVQNAINELKRLEERVDVLLKETTMNVTLTRNFFQPEEKSEDAIISPAPLARSFNFSDSSPPPAQTRLIWFTGISYVLAVLFLAGAGFSELYIDQPIFGATPWTDYFGLFAWGFGSEATRDAITKMVKSWELPGVM